MRQIIADFSRLEERPGLGLSIVLGSETTRPELHDLQEEEEVLLIEPENVEAKGVVRHEDTSEQRFWFGVLTGPIEDSPPLSN
jgi:hypothetical protein